MDEIESFCLTKKTNETLAEPAATACAVDDSQRETLCD